MNYLLRVYVHKGGRSRLLIPWQFELAIVGFAMVKIELVTCI